MIPLFKRAAHVFLLAASCVWWTSPPQSLLADDAMFQGVVAGRRVSESPDARDEAVFQGRVIDQQRAGRSDLTGAAQQGRNLAPPTFGVFPREVQRSRLDNRPAAPRIGISIGIGIGGSSRSAPRKPAPLGPKR